MQAVSVVSQRNGTYAAHFRTTAAGTYSALVSIRSVASNATEFLVRPAAAAAAASHASGAGLRNAVAGEPASVHLHVRTLLVPSSHYFDVWLRGCARCSYVCWGRLSRTRPWPYYYSTGVLSMESSAMECRAVLRVRAFVLGHQPSDAYGNLDTGDGPSPRVALHVKTGLGVFKAVAAVSEDSYNLTWTADCGCYTLAYSVEVAGALSISVTTADGEPFVASPFHAQVGRHQTSATDGYRLDSPLPHTD